MTPERMTEIREYLDRPLECDDKNQMIKDLVYALDAAHHANAIDTAAHLDRLGEAYRAVHWAEDVIRVLHETHQDPDAALRAHGALREACVITPSRRTG